MLVCRTPFAVDAVCGGVAGGEALACAIGVAAAVDTDDRVEASPAIAQLAATHAHLGERFDVAVLVVTTVRMSDAGLGAAVVDTDAIFTRCVFVTRHELGDLRHAGGLGAAVAGQTVAMDRTVVVHSPQRHACAVRALRGAPTIGIDGAFGVEGRGADTLGTHAATVWDCVAEATGLATSIGVAGYGAFGQEDHVRVRGEHGMGGATDAVAAAAAVATNAAITTARAEACVVLPFAGRMPVVAHGAIASATRTARLRGAASLPVAPVARTDDAGVEADLAGHNQYADRRAA